MPSRLVQIQCQFCKEIKCRHISDIKKAINNTGYWACKTCTLVQRNKDNATPVGSKRTVAKGYIEIKTNNGWTREHRYVMEQYLGRKLKKDEIIHHKDENKKNNIISNLELLLHGEHTKYHHTGAKRSEETKRLISESKKRKHIYEKHPSYKHITMENLKNEYLKYGTIEGACVNLGITKCTFYNKLKHFNITMEELCRQ